MFTFANSTGGENAYRVETIEVQGRSPEHVLIITFRQVGSRRIKRIRYAHLTADGVHDLLDKLSNGEIAEKKPV